LAGGVEQTRLKHRRDHAQRGFILITALWTLTLLAVIVAGLVFMSKSEIDRTRNTIALARAEAAADAGIYRGIAALLEPRLERRWAADGAPYEMTLDDARVTIALEDEGGKIDLNTAPDAVLRQLFAWAGADDDEATRLADALADWRDANHVRRLNGAEDDDYAAAGREIGAKDAPFLAVEELSQVLGVTPEMFARVAPALTVYSRRLSVHRPTATRLVRDALGFADDEAAAPPAARKIAADDATNQPGGEDAAEDAAGTPVMRHSGVNRYTIRSQAVTAEGARFAREAVVRLTRKKDAPFQILSWRRTDFR
jgi:general secretion pathway protein K